MSVLVQMRVKAPDVDRFVAAHNKFDGLSAEMGAKNRRVYKSESDPNEGFIYSDRLPTCGFAGVGLPFGDAGGAVALVRVLEL